MIDSLLDVIIVIDNGVSDANLECASQTKAHPRSDFDGGDVRHWVHILHGGVVRVAVGELHSHSPLVGHHVSVGDDEAVAADDETRAVGHGDFSPRERVPVKEQSRRRSSASESEERFKFD